MLALDGTSQDASGDLRMGKSGRGAFPVHRVPAHQAQAKRRFSSGLSCFPIDLTSLNTHQRKAHLGRCPGVGWASKSIVTFCRLVVEWRKTHENAKKAKSAKKHSGFELSSPSRVDLTSRKVGLQTRGAPFYLNRTTLHGGDTPHSEKAPCTRTHSEVQGI